jgi:hypothetical protein
MMWLTAEDCDVILAKASIPGPRQTSVEPRQEPAFGEELVEAEPVRNILAH